ncbi:ABC transporter substrate-binding protein [Gracilibacillus thailandensis]|nr:extracellular solute-binding protein [Gracilibacillus thailandensis]
MKRMIQMLSGILFFVVLIGCQEDSSLNESETGEKEGSDDIVNLRVLHSFTGSQPQAPVMEPAFEAFDEEHDDIQLNIQTAAGNDILEQLRTEMAAEDPPDVFTHWGMRRTENYIKNGVIPDISDMIESDQDLDGLYMDGAFGPVTYQGGIYGLPFQGYSYYLMINKDLFEEHGVDIPTNYEELKKAVIQFTDVGLIPFAANNHSARYMLLTWFAQKQTTEDLRSYATAEQEFGEDLLLAAEKAQELAELGAFPEGYMNLETAQSLEIFHAEQAPMFYQHSWTVGSIDEELLDSYEIIPFPLGDEQSEPTVLAGTGHFIYMSQRAYDDPDKREAAWKLMKKIAGRDVAKGFVEDIANNTALNVEYDEENVNPILNQILDDMDNAEKLLPSYEEELFASAVEGEYWPLTDALLLGDITPQEYVDQMNDIVSEHPNVQFE